MLFHLGGGVLAAAADHSAFTVGGLVSDLCSVLNLSLSFPLTSCLSLLTITFKALKKNF